MDNDLPNFDADSDFAAFCIETGYEGPGACLLADVDEDTAAVVAVECDTLTR